MNLTCLDMVGRIKDAKYKINITSYKISLRLLFQYNVISNLILYIAPAKQNETNKGVHEITA